jgi:hypothetical protein
MPASEETLQEIKPSKTVKFLAGPKQARELLFVRGFFQRAIAKDKRVITTGVSNKVMEEGVFTWWQRKSTQSQDDLIPVHWYRVHY